MNFVIRPVAKDDILRQFRYYLLQEAIDAAPQFLDAVDEAICKMLHMGAPKPLKNATQRS